MLLGVLGTQEMIILVVLGIAVWLLIKYASRGFFGGFLLTVGIGILIYGINILNQLNAINKSLQGRLANALSSEYVVQSAHARSEGTTSCIVGSIFIIVGIVLLAKRPGPVERQTTDFKPMAHPQPQFETLQTAPSTSVNEKYTQLEKLGKLRDQGILSDDEFQAENANFSFPVANKSSFYDPMQ